MYNDSVGHTHKLKHYTQHIVLVANSKEIDCKRWRIYFSKIENGPRGMDNILVPHIHIIKTHMTFQAVSGNRPNTFSGELLWKAQIWIYILARIGAVVRLTLWGDEALLVKFD